MGYDRSDYWREAVEIALSEAGVVATPEQIKDIGGSMECSAENIGQAFYSPPAGEYEESESARLRRELKIEREKVYCKQCNGHGRIITQGPYHSSDSQCFKCHGDGRHTP